MSRFHSYINSASAILSLYNGEIPFAPFIKKYFSENKKFGSADRKQVSHLCYCYFRLGKALRELPVEERILTGLFLCSTGPGKLLEELRPAWNQQTGLSPREKLHFLGYPSLPGDVFPWKDELSSEIDREEFILSHFQQPDLFIRLRPGKEEIVKDKLLKAGLPFQQVADHCLALPNSSKIEEILSINSEVVIQDYSSQRMGEMLENLKPLTSNIKLSVWDCCAASGGKSIMAKDVLGEMDLSVSDTRESILVNLGKRFEKAGITAYHSFVADLTSPVLALGHRQFDLVIADAPCSGSGTWSRTPEQLYYFDEKKIADYAELQQKILSTVIHHLAPGGFLLYITCSVFKIENEEVTAFIKKQFHLREVKMELLKGYDKKADSLFAALLEKPL